MIVITGAGGFIGSTLTSALNRQGLHNLILVDDFDRPEKRDLIKDLRYEKKIDRDLFLNWFEKNSKSVAAVYHLGARTDTKEKDYAVMERLNLSYSQMLWDICSNSSIPIIYASSAATYGDGTEGYDDNTPPQYLTPLNPYAVSKNEFDKWVLARANMMPFWMGFKFFNVYGPREYHKGPMASVVFHASNQLKQNKEVKLFRSHKAGYQDGEQLRDFIYVEDVCKVLIWAMNYKPLNGIYNLGTGKARSFKDLALAVCDTLGFDKNISYIDTPEDIRDSYQYFTEAKMNKLAEADYIQPFLSLEEGIQEYFNS